MTPAFYAFISVVLGQDFWAVALTICSVYGLTRGSVMALAAVRKGVVHEDRAPSAPEDGMRFRRLLHAPLLIGTVVSLIALVLRD